MPNFIDAIQVTDSNNVTRTVIDTSGNITIGTTLSFADNETLYFGTGSDVGIVWDATNLIISAAADDSLIEIGDSAVTQKSFDLKWYGNGASGVDFLYLDASDNLIYTTGIDLQFKDNDFLVFGTGAGAGGDIAITWNATQLVMTSVAASSGFLIGAAGNVINSTQHGTVTVGVNDTGYDVKLFGATTGKYLLWDESADQLIVVGSMALTGSETITGDITLQNTTMTNSIVLKETTAADSGRTTNMLFQFTNAAAAARNVGAFGAVTTAEGVGRIFISTATTSAGSITEKFTVLNDGNVGINDTNPDKKLSIQGTVKVGVDDTGYDVQFFGATAGKYLLWDESADSLIVNGITQLGATTTAALLIGGGTSASKLTTATADKNFGGVWTESTATSGDSRGLYWRHYLGGTIATTGYGDAVRAFCTVTGTGYSYASGIHATMQINTGATVTGSGAGARATLAAEAESRTLVGAIAALQVDSDIGTGNTVPARCSLIRLAKAGAVDVPFFLDISDDQCLKGSAATGAASDALAVVMPDGSTRYISLIAAS